ncbi:MAG: outer membrane protein transport protein [Pedobacter sp.]|nr:outer membrane protein transport protein [Pedobacter sp.]
MKKLLFSLAAIVVASGTSYAQSYAPDALRFSQTNFGSSARFKGMAGAQIGVGGDMGSITSNPAGLGLFTKSEFSLTPEFNSMKGSANYLNTNTSSSKESLNLNNLGVVLYSPTYRAKGQDTQTGLISSVFGFGYARNNDFSADFSYGGINPTNSIADFYAERANASGQAPDNLGTSSLARMAYDGYLIGYGPANPSVPGSPNIYFPETDINNMQRKSEIRSGSTSELTAAGALNISNQIYLGASVGLVNIRYVNNSEYTEGGFNVTENSNYSLSMRQNQETTGSGINGRLGIIFRPVSNFRVGATFQTPTWLLIEDNYTVTLDTRIATGAAAGNYVSDPENSPFRYKLRTPLKGSLGVSYIVAQKALLTADIDYTDYSTIQFSNDINSSDPNRIRAENANVKANYKEAFNYRLGVEYKLDNAFSLRGGYGLNGSAIKVDDSSYFDAKIYSGGLGYRVDNYYFDVAYQRFQTNTVLAPYELNDFSEPAANIKTTRNNVFLTFGVRF